MGEKITSIMNEHWCRALLERDSLDYSKFYRKQLEQFLNVSRADTKKYKTRNEKAIVFIKNILPYLSTTDKVYELLNILQGSDSNVKD